MAGMIPSERVQALMLGAGLGLVPDPSVPEADWSRWLEFYQADAGAADPPAAQDTRECPECGGELVERNGRHGAFLGCSGYPTCEYTENG